MNSLFAAIQRSFEAQFFKLSDDPERQEKVADKLYTWLVTKARKKPVPDLQSKLEDWRKRLDHLAENLEIKFEKDKLVVKSAGSAEDTLKRLRLGSDWFDGSPDILEMVVSGLFKTDSVSI